MSWEEMSTRYIYYHCACKTGKVIETTVVEGDDWNRFREHTSYSIDCSECSKKYHLEGDYLVPNGLTISLKLRPTSKPYEYNIGFKCNVLGRYTPEEIQEVIKDMETAKNNSHLTLDRSKEIVKIYYRANRRKRLSLIISDLVDLLHEYDLYENNYFKLIENEKIELEEIRQNEIIYNENIKHCVKLVEL